jgi:DNA (cytosine-5)-methyltransferase 1
MILDTKRPTGSKSKLPVGNTSYITGVIHLLIKSRRAKNSSRGIYLQDRQLGDTVFQPGTHYKYAIDVVNRKVIILSSESEGNIVSKRDMKQFVKPVLDIRNKEALSAFQGCDYLQVEIFEDQVVISGYASEDENLVAKAKRFVSKLTGRKNNVRDITELLQVRRKAQIVLSKTELNQAVGGYEQLSFSFTEDDVSTAKSSSIRYMEQALQHLNIALQVDSLFSGAGIFDIAFVKAGFEVVFAVEMNSDAVRTYRSYFGNHIHEADITKVDMNRYSSPIMIGGSPCQGFSNSNRYTNYLDNPNNKLLRAYIDAIKANKNCQIFVLENVPQLLTAGGGKFKDEILTELSDFEIDYDILNSADYGSPQIRKRAIMIGSRGRIGRIGLPEKTHSKDDYVSVREAFNGLTTAIPNQKDYSKAKPETLRRIQSVPPGGNVHDIPLEFRPKGTHSDMYKRIEWEKPSITIVNPRKAMLLHPEEDRILSVRECARIQGLPDDFIFHGALSSRQQQVANGVPFQLAHAIAKVIRQAITKFNIRSRLESAF